MSLVKFDHTVKYNGEQHKAHTVFEVEELDLEDVVSKGAIIVAKTSGEEGVQKADTDKSFQYMTIPEIKDYAESIGCDISGANKKDQMIAEIKKFLEKK